MSSARSTSTPTASGRPVRPRRTGAETLWFMRTIRHSYRSRRRVYWSQDNLSANWTPDIRAFAATNRLELVPTPTYASYLNRIAAHVATATAPTATDASPRLNAATSSPPDMPSAVKRSEATH
jgi:hypothetical protein